MVAHSEHIDQLIARYLAGEALPEEAVQLDDWLELSPGNRGYFAQVEQVYRKAHPLAQHTFYDSEIAWAKVKAGMRGAAPIAKVVPLYKRYAALLAAAAIALLVGLPLMLFYSGILSPETINQVASNEAVGTSYTLADSSEVVLNRNSIVTYSSKYGEQDRRVKLTGEAFFEVKHLKNKPFLVEVNGVVIEDIGTGFNVKAYDSTGTVEVYVETGSVRFYTSASNSVTLVAGQIGVYNKAADTFTVKGDANINVIAYKTKQFVFVDTPLDVALKELEAVYNMPIEVGNPALNHCRITVNFDNENIDSVLEIIAETLGLTVDKTSTGYRLNGEGCAR